MKYPLLKTLTALTLSAFTLHVYAENVDVTPSDNQVTQQELAALYVLSDICPSVIDAKAQNKFEQGFGKLLKENMPQVKDPAQTLKALAQDPKFAPILQEAQADAKKAGDAKNLEICQELTTYAN
ncbi:MULTISPECIES: MCR_0457 family protein [Acinetobacter]|jgi:hypothetical protein|uniref:DUF7944 domain-containing protein n=1 Tax=Acinetobacter chengduensis TaxID=2420890 RepID=A0ABX9TX07_9GAMM|nr:MULTISPECIES: hypothetical protein [Acinetobacter]MBI1450608.1 hypothetical protein [Acinetobacter sp. FL51]RKG40694.1 hypothetical protein D7V31_11385 [Acinetobacter sp. WCHAc060007]RLL22102.1 hypothetical protein D9K81_08085 [Acinetobacter chengduensis]